MAEQSTIAESLGVQFRKACETIRAAITVYPESEWARRKRGCLPLQQAYHTIGGIDMYCGPGEFRWDSRFLGPDGRFSWRAEPPDPPTQQEMLDYLDRMQQHVSSWLGSLPDDEIVELQEPTGSHSGRCILDRCVYLLRHTQHHLGMLESDMIRRGLKLPEWK